MFINLKSQPAVSGGETVNIPAKSWSVNFKLQKSNLATDVRVYSQRVSNLFKNKSDNPALGAEHEMRDFIELLIWTNSAYIDKFIGQKSSQIMLHI